MGAFCVAGVIVTVTGTDVLAVKFLLAGTNSASIWSDRFLSACS